MCGSSAHRSPGFVIKTHDKQGRKIFINLVSHELLKRPVNAQMKEVDDEHLDTRGIGNLRVPLDVGKPRTVQDNNGGTATACDVVFHPSVVQRGISGRNTAHFQHDLANLAISWVEKEIGSEIKRDFKVLL